MTKKIASLPSPADFPQADVVIYDGECQLCVATKRKLEQAGIGPAQVRFIPYQSAEAKQALGTFYGPGRPEMAYLVQPSGDIREGLDAFLPLAAALPAGRALLWFIRIRFVRRVSELLYRFIARHRYRWFGEAR